MAARLGRVIYWAACAVALLWIGVSILAGSSRSVPNWWVDGSLGLIGAALIWITGRAVLYILAGK